MAFCIKCGQELSHGAQFCANCGASVSNNQNENQSERRREYAGKIIKCPACGESIQSFTAICPACGHEINSQRVSASVKSFVDSVNEYDNAIANNPEPTKNGWKTWTNAKKILWVLLNIFTSCIPLVIYLAWPLLKPFLKPNKVPVLSSDEKRKASLIENYTFPNEREATIEAMMFTKSKMAFLASERFNDKTLYWTNLWNTKAEQLNQRAMILLVGDKIVEATYNEITGSKEKVHKKIKMRAIVGATIIFAYLAFIGIFGSMYNTIGTLSGNAPVAYKDTASPTISVDTVTDEKAGIYTYEIRNYVGKNVASVGSINGSFTIDEYGAGELRMAFVTEDGMLVSKSDEIAKHHTVVGQSIKSGSPLTIVHLRDNNGEPYSNLVDYQSYDELILYVAPVENTSYQPTSTELRPTLDRHIYHIRDYVGRNAASFGTVLGNDRIDEYGSGELRIAFTAEDGSYVDVSDINNLKEYVVVDQDIAPNTELKLNYETDSKGEEYDNLIRSQNYEEINLTVRRLGEDIISQMPILENTGNSNDTSDYEKLTIKYKVVGIGKAKITGFSGDGNHATIDSKIDGYEVVSIGDSAFKDCTTLESVLFWADIESIGDYAFAGCTALKSISIPNETTQIGDHAFDGCTNLSHLIIWGSPNIGEYAFTGCTSITSVSIDTETKKIGAHAFDGCTNLSSAIIWGDDTKVGKDAFANCPNLTDRPIQEE